MQGSPERRNMDKTERSPNAEGLDTSPGQESSIKTAKATDLI